MIKHIPLLVPDMPGADEILPFLREIDRSHWYTNFGPLLQRFEAGVARTIGHAAPGVATVANCTLGLEVALAALGLKPGARVLVPALTFAATATAVLRAGLVAVLGDIDHKSWLLTPAIARAAATRHELACIMPVAAFGCPHPVAAWDNFHRESGLPVVIDAAGAFGNQQVGESAIAVFSFHATKAFGIGEGGLIAARDEQFVAMARRLTNFGIDISTGLVARPGTNAKMSEYHAAVGLATLARWPARAARRRSLFADYSSRLRALCPAVMQQARPVNGIYSIMQVLLPDGADRERVAALLARDGIETRSWYLPLLDRHPAFAKNCVDSSLHVAKSIAPRLLGLPFHLDLDERALGRICTGLSQALGSHA